MTLMVPWPMLALILAAVTMVALILGGFAGYRFGCRDNLEEASWLRDLPPVLPDQDGPPLTPLDPADPVDRLILEARMYEP